MSSGAGRFAIAVGGNVGATAAHAERAERLLSPFLRVIARSAWLRTPALVVPGSPPQADYANAVWIVASDLGPHQLLDRLLAAESACGRTRARRWGPRTLDLDIILCGDGRAVASPVLTIPHPRWRERGFVTAPLREVAPEWPVPPHGRTVRELCA